MRRRPPGVLGDQRLFVAKFLCYTNGKRLRTSRTGLLPRDLRAVHSLGGDKHPGEGLPYALCYGVVELSPLSLPDDHPIWATVALLAAVIGKGNEDAALLRAEITRLGAEIAEVKGMLRLSSAGGAPELTDIAAFMDQVSGALSGAAHLDAAMPGFLERLEEVLGGIRKDIASIEGRLDGREGS